MVKCPNCGRENAANFNFCLDCGYDLKAYREALPATTAPASPSAPPPPVAPPAPIAAPVAPPPPRVPTNVAPLPPAGLPPLPPPPAFGGAALPAPPPPALASTTGMAAAPMPPPSLVIAPSPAGPPPAGPLPRAPTIAPIVGMASMVVSPAPRVDLAPPPAVSLPPAASGGPVCGACQAPNAPGVRFCGNCGSRIDGSAASLPPQDGAQRTMFMHAHVAEPIQKVVKLITIDQTGREGMTFTLRAGETLCGRVSGVILFDDPHVSPSHCRFLFQAGRLKVADASSLNGVYLRVRSEKVLEPGDHLRVGRQLFRFENLDAAVVHVKRADGDDSKVWGSPHPGAFGRIVQLLDDGSTGEIRLLAGERVQIGREIGDIVIPSDGFISGRHCVFTKGPSGTLLQDLGSSNGTYLRVKGEADVVHGDFLLVGNQMLRVEIV